MRILWPVLRSYGAASFLGATCVLTFLGCALGPGSRYVITRNGALGEPLPFVLALTGVAAMVCLGEPAQQLVRTMARPSWQGRLVRVSFVFLTCGIAVTVSAMVGWALAPATVRNASIALAITFTVSCWRPLLAWVPTSAYLVLSWFRGTATFDHGAASWAVPAKPPDWAMAGYCSLGAMMAATVWIWFRSYKDRARSTNH